MALNFSNGSADREPATCEHIFVYGTLMGGHRSHRAWPTQSASIAPACAAGVMFDLGRYPAMVPLEVGATVRWVLGEVHRVTEGLPEVLGSLDVYEECRPEDEAGSLYIRRLVRAITGRGQVRAWAYYLNDPAELARCGSHYPAIETNCEFDGLPAASWRVHLANRR